MSGTRSASRTAPATRRPEAESGALLLCAHGSPGSGASLARRAAAIGRRGSFAEAAGALLYGEPRLEEVAARLRSGRVYVAPLFLSMGTTFRALKARLADLPNAESFRLCPPLGAHPRLAAGILEAATSELRRNGWQDGEVALVLAAHGSRRGPASRQATLGLARQISDAGRLGRVACAFLEEPPALDEVVAGLPQRQVIVAGCFAEDGNHAREDVPDLIRRSGREALYLGPIGAASWSDALILANAVRAMDEAGGTLTAVPQLEEQSACVKQP